MVSKVDKHYAMTQTIPLKCTCALYGIPALHEQLAQEREEHKKTQLELKAACQQLDEEKMRKRKKSTERESLSSVVIKSIVVEVQANCKIMIDMFPGS